MYGGQNVSELYAKKSLLGLIDLGAEDNIHGPLWADVWLQSHENAPRIKKRKFFQLEHSSLPILKAEKYSQ